MLAVVGGSLELASHAKHVAPLGDSVGSLEVAPE